MGLLDDARRELAERTAEQIQRETADKWCARAVVAYEFFAQTGDLAWHARAVEYAHEAAEHAAEAGPGVLEVVRVTTDLARARAGG